MSLEVISGRISVLRKLSKKLCFAELDDSPVPQLVFNIATLEGCDFPVMGDVITASGHPRTRENGQEQIVVQAWQHLEPSDESLTVGGVAHGTGRKLTRAPRCDASFAQCPLCGPGLMQRRYAYPDGLRAHVLAVHEAAAPQDADCELWLSKLLDDAGTNTSRSRIISGGGRLEKAEFCAKQDNQQTLPPCLVAAQNGDSITLGSLIEAGWCPLASPGSLDRHGASAIDYAAGGGHTELLREVLLPAARKSGRLCRRRDGRTCLHWAARHGHAGVLRFLLEDFPVEHLASLIGFSLQTGSNIVDAPTAEGTTALHLAAFGGHVEAMEVLLVHGAQLLHANGWGCDVSHWAAMGGSVKACEWLSSRDVSFFKLQSEGHTALHKAAMRGQDDVLKFLIDGQVEVEELSRLKENLAAASNNGDVVGHCLDSQRTTAHAPSRLASKAGYQKLAHYLKEQCL